MGNWVPPVYSWMWWRRNYHLQRKPTGPTINVSFSLSLTMHQVNAFRLYTDYTIHIYICYNIPILSQVFYFTVALVHSATLNDMYSLVWKLFPHDCKSMWYFLFINLHWQSCRVVMMYQVRRGRWEVRADSLLIEAVHNKMEEEC